MTGTTNHRNGVALVMGVGHYPHPEIARLEFAARDAQAMAGALTDRDVCAFPTEQVVLLTDEQARRDAIVRHLSQWLPERARGAEIVLLYFAGHGLVHRVGKKEEGFLLPHDADPDNPLGRGVAMSDLTRWIEELEASAVVVCLDCCHAGKLLTRGNRPESIRRRDLALRRSVLEEVAGKGRFLLASCDEGQVSVESEEQGHGLFTYHLLRGLAGAGDRDGDGKVGVAELFEYVAEAVARDAKRLGVEQKPWSASVGAGGVYLAAPSVGMGTSAPCDPPSAATAATSAPPAPAAQSHRGRPAPAANQAASPVPAAVPPALRPARRTWCGPDRTRQQDRRLQRAPPPRRPPRAGMPNVR
jgi:hypothetical protein